MPNQLSHQCAVAPFWIFQILGDRAHNSNTSIIWIMSSHCEWLFPRFTSATCLSYSVRISCRRRLFNWYEAYTLLRLNFLVVRMQSLLTALWISLLEACIVRLQAVNIVYTLRDTSHPSLTAIFLWPFVHYMRRKGATCCQFVSAAMAWTLLRRAYLNSFTWSWNTGTLIPQKR